MKGSLLSLIAGLIALAAFAGSAMATPVSRSNAVGPLTSTFRRKVLVQKPVRSIEVRGLLRRRCGLRGEPFRRELVQAGRAGRPGLSEPEGFSRSGLIAQLEYEGFSPSQALYGVRSVGL